MIWEEPSSVERWRSGGSYTKLNNKCQKLKRMVKGAGKGQDRSIGLLMMNMYTTQRK